MGNNHKVMEHYRLPWLAIALNTFMFSAGHIFNPGVETLSLMNIMIFGILLSLPMVYMKNSLWWAYGFHTAWNFSQSILLGLPNSGVVFPYSVLRIDATKAKNSFAYHVNFGVEGTLLATALASAVCVIWILYAR